MSFHKLFICTIAASLIIAAGCGGGEETAEMPGEAPAEEYFEVDPATAATVTGKVSLEGTPPTNPRLNMSAEPDCAQLHDDPVRADAVEVGEGGGLANVFVWIKEGLGDKRFAPPSSAVNLDQKGCIYRPHVLALQTNQPLSVTNSDPTTHNVHPLPRVNREWNKSQTSSAPPIERKFTREEIMLPVKCNIHPWMRAYISVVSHPFYAVTDKDGAFEIKGLPPGDYTIESIHEKYDSNEESITVGPSESKQVDFTYTAG